MHELLVERPRSAHAERYPRTYVRNLTGASCIEDAPLREPLSRARYGDKQLSENFAPLIRFLRSNVGRPWSKVHSEMAKVLAPSNAVQRHVLDHLADFLRTHVTERNGELWAASKRGGPERLVVRRRRDVFYVHPRTGLLSVIRNQRAKRNPLVRELSATKQLRRVGGIWYLLTLAPIPTWPASDRVVDAMARRRVDYKIWDVFPELHDIWASRRYTIARRAVTKRELRYFLGQ